MALAVALLCAAHVEAAVTAGAGARDQAGLAWAAPDLEAVVEAPTAKLVVGYVPRFFEGAASGVRHDALAALTFRESRNLTLGAAQAFGYGRNELQLDAGKKKPFDLLDPLVPPVAGELSSDTEVYASYLWSRSLVLTAGGGYQLYGGATSAARALLPLQRGVQVYASAEDELTRVDRLSLDLGASHTAVLGGTDNSLVQLASSWRRALGETTRARLALGTSLVQRAGTELWPVVDASLVHGIGHLELTAEAGAGPHTSRLTGVLVRRLEAGGAARLELGDLSLRARAAGADDAGVGKLFALGADAALRLRRDLSWTFGAEAVTSAARGAQSAVFTALTFGAVENR